jgi:hypothetical protein
MCFSYKGSFYYTSRKEQIKNIIALARDKGQNRIRSFMAKIISESEFYMWRAVFATAHADQKVTGEEIRYLAEVLEDNPFTKKQRDVLIQDIVKAQDIAEMFRGITEQTDRARFFRLARELVWVDGDFGKEEQELLLKLQKAQVAAADLHDMIGKTNLKLDDKI